MRIIFVSIFTFAVVLTGVCAFGVVSCAKAPGVHVAKELSLGSVELKILVDARHERDASILVAPENPALLKNIPENFSMISDRCVLLARYKKEVVLFDTGLGSANGGMLLEALKEAGFAPNDITGIFITHLHGDHFGGLLHEGKPAFPKATVYLSEEEAGYFLRSDLSDIPERDRGRFEPVNLLFDQLRGAGISVITFPSGSDLTDYFGNGNFSFKSLQAFGHTPGHTLYILGSQGKEFLFWGDILHVIDIQLAYPGISATYDMDTRLASSERSRILEYAAANGILVGGAHVIAPGVFTISKKDGGFVRNEVLP
jgi:glyoxylase-like metal-dependent hydrolase (beta-lactamase superfamily II)